MREGNYRAIQVNTPGKFEMVESAVTQPPPGEVRIRVEACGVCHPDAVTVEGSFRISPIRGCQAMRSSAKSTPSAKAFRAGNLANGSVSDTWVAPVFVASSAEEAILSAA